MLLVVPYETLEEDVAVCIKIFSTLPEESIWCSLGRYREELLVSRRARTTSNC